MKTNFNHLIFYLGGGLILAILAGALWNNDTFSNMVTAATVTFFTGLIILLFYNVFLKK